MPKPKCRDCRGTGENYDLCGGCHGAGSHRGVKCPHCKGSGLAPTKHKCDTCRGSGIDPYVTDTEDTETKEEEKVCSCPLGDEDKDCPFHGWK